MAKLETRPYACRSNGDLYVDIFSPVGRPKAAVLLIHGGGWRSGDKIMVHPAARVLAGLGFLALAVQYRLLDQAPWPAPVADVISAIRWARKNSAALGIEPNKIAIEGFSAGGHLSLLAAAKTSLGFSDPQDDVQISASVAAVIAFFAPIEFQVSPTQLGVSDASRLFGGECTEAQLRLASPVHCVDTEFPPTCIFHGTDDHVVEPSVSLRLFDRLRGVGATADLHIFAGHTHEFSALPIMVSQVQSIVASFVDRHVVRPEVYREENRTLNPFYGGKRP